MSRLNKFTLLRYFRINDPYRLLGLLVLLALLSLPRFIESVPLTYPELKAMIVGEKVREGYSLYTELIDTTPPLTAWCQALFDYLFGRSLIARHIFTFFIVFVQAAFIGFVFIDKKAFTENTFIPSLVFSVLFLFSFDTFSLTGEVLASGFILLALNNLYKELEFRAQGDDAVLKLGFYISLASLCSFSFMIYLPAALTILVIFSGSELRKKVLLVFSFMLPHMLLITIFYWKSSAFDMWQYYYLPGLQFAYVSLISFRSLLWLLALPFLYWIISLVMLNREARLSKYQSQLLLSMFLWVIFSIAQIVYSKEIRPQSFIVLFPSLSFFYTHYLLLIRRKKFAEISLWVLILGIAAVGYAAHYKKISSVHYENLMVADRPNSGIRGGQKILMLGDDMTVYRTNQLATGFLNWNLSKEIFEHPDYYEHVDLISKAFKRDAPQVIIDPQNLMQGYWDRIPELRKKYRQGGNSLYYRKP